MAETKKKSAAGGSKRRSAASEAEKRRAELIAQNARRRRLISVILFAVGLLITAFTLFGRAEGDDLSAWDGIHTFIYGVFGLSSFLVGPILIYIAVMLSAERTKATIAKRMLQLLLMILFISAAAQVFFVGSVGDPSAAETSLGENISYAYENGTRLVGGGAAGLILGTPLLLFGQGGAIVILLLVSLVVFMLMTNLTVVDLLRAVSKPFRKAGNYAREQRERYREESALAEEERAEREAKLREEKAARRSEQSRALPADEERARKFAEIANVTTNAQREVSEEEKREAKEKNARAVAEDPIAIQKKESREFQKDLNAFLSGKLEKREETVTQKSEETAPSITERSPDDGPYRPDGPFFADEKAPEPIKPEIIGEQRTSLVGQAPAPAPETEAETEDEGDRIVEAIRDFGREQEEKLREEEKREEKLLATVIRPDESGQGHFEEILSEAEQYKVPPSELLNDVIHERSDEDIHAEIQTNAEKLVETLKSFGVQTRFLEASRGPSVTRYELQPAPGVKIAKITGLVDDIALNLASAGVRIEAPIPNKAAVGIEVPNKTIESVPFREMVESAAFTGTKSKLGAVLGKSISGEVVIADIAKMPHILIAGTTGSGKSVCVNSIIMSILFRSTPDDVRFLMIDPKAVEFMIYNGIPHLLIPVVTDPKKAAGALAWAVTEMLNRYKLFSDHSVRDLESYNKLARANEEIEPLPQVVIFIDELADLMMASPGEVEDSICRLAQMAR
ncbi:MAG: FtsK/SpoIIIE domain-containing protein, partial [Eubacterium sp.]|nr:FtsK/SpoIIIE domain-containing protein [Eubacterium sp.]